MFKLINTFNDDVVYLKELVKTVQAEQKYAQSEITTDKKEVSVQLLHYYQVNRDRKTVANIRYSSTEQLLNGHAKCDSDIKVLIDGVDYDYAPLNNLLGEIVKHTNEYIDMAVMCGGSVEKDDVQVKARAMFIAALRSVGIYWDFNISAVVVDQQLSELIVTVS